MRDHESLYTHVRAKDDLDTNGKGRTDGRQEHITLPLVVIVVVTVVVTVGENLNLALLYHKSSAMHTKQHERVPNSSTSTVRATSCTMSTQLL